MKRFFKRSTAGAKVEISELDRLETEVTSLRTRIAELSGEVEAVSKERDLYKQQLAGYLKFVPPGHYYSSIPDLIDVVKNEDRIWRQRKELAGINLYTERQISLLSHFKIYYDEMPFPVEKDQAFRFFYENPAYSYSDAIFLHCMIRHIRPRRIIEIGSGYSSCMTIDTNDLFFKGTIDIDFIEPYPELLNTLLFRGDTDRYRIHDIKLQEIPIDFFKRLKSNDILFVDSTHVSKVGSDVNYIIHEILPILQEGVYIHFHDVFYPFEYPKYWVLEGRVWTEQYLLRAFLEFNSSFEIVLFNTYLLEVAEEILRRDFPLIYKNPGGSIWIRKTH